MKKGIEEEFGEYVRSCSDEIIIDERQDPRRVFFLRPSQLPFCALRRFLDMAENGVPKSRTMNAEGLYYTSNGTNVHRVFQDILGRGGRILGDWKCPICKATRKFKKYKRCKKCDVAMVYEELEVKVGAWRGHLDGLYHTLDDRLFIPDYKTTNLRFVQNKKSTPHFDYIEQQRYYVVLLSMAYKIDIAGWMLVYLSRDNPFKQRRVFTVELRQKTKDAIREDIKRSSSLHKKMFKIKKVEEVNPLYENKRCETRVQHDRIYRWDACPYADKCFDKKTMVSTIRSIVNKSQHLPLIQFMPPDIREELYG